MILNFNLALKFRYDQNLIKLINQLIKQKALKPNPLKAIKAKKTEIKAA